MRAELAIKKSELKPSGLEKITQVFSESLKRWREEEPFRLEGEMLFYCPACSFTIAESHSMVKRYGRPRCLACGVEMVDFDEGQFKELRQRLADEALSIASRAVEALLEVVEAHGGDILFVEVYDQMLYMRPDYALNEFRYDAGAKRFEAYYHYYSTPGHVMSLKTLIEKAWELNFGILVQIHPGYMTMPLPYGYLPAVQPKHGFFNGVEIKMTAEELRDFFARGFGRL